MITKLCYMPITDFYIDICDANAAIIMFKLKIIIQEYVNAICFRTV